MTREEAKKILMAISAAYPNYKPQDFTATVNAWFVMLQDYTYEQISEALRAYILTDTKGFAPVIGQLVEKVTMLQGDRPIGELEAWSLVYKAICNSNYNYKEEFEKLPPIIQRTIGNPEALREWASMDIGTVQSVEQSHFIRNYREMVSISMDEAKLPSPINDRLDTKCDDKTLLDENF